MRPEKQEILKEIGSRVSSSTFVLVADYRGLSGEQFMDLRRKLDKVDARIQVVKNRLLRLVVREHGWQNIEPSLRGQSALVTGADVVQTAKVLKQFGGASNGIPAVKAGMMGNVALTSAQVDALAELPPREALLGQFVGTVAAPLSRLVGVMKQKVSTIVYALKAIEEKKNAK